MKTLEEKIKVMQAALEGKSIEFSPGFSGKWHPAELDCLFWNWGSADFRVAPDTQDEIDWSVFEDNWRYVARDQNGAVALYEKCPDRDYTMGYWVSCKGASKQIEGLFKGIYKRGNCRWDNTLIERPSNK